MTNGNAVNGNLKDEAGEASGEYKFTLPPDEEGIVYQCHLCSYTATTRANFNTHVNTHYDFQCLKCDFECKVSWEILLDAGKIFFIIFSEIFCKHKCRVTCQGVIRFNFSLRVRTVVT